MIGSRKHADGGVFNCLKSLSILIMEDTGYDHAIRIAWLSNCSEFCGGDEIKCGEVPNKQIFFSALDAVTFLNCGKWETRFSLV